MSERRFALFVASAPGLEPVLLRELAELDLTGQATLGGVLLTASLEQAYRVLLWVGTALFVSVRVARFRAVHFAQLEQELSRVDWPAFLPHGERTQVKATSRKSKLYHTGAIVERIERALSRLGAGTEASGDPLTLRARFDHDLCTLSLDLSGEPLRKRGYRLESGKAPLREDLARALLRVAGFERPMALLDPLCGSGTLVIEAARMVSGRPPLVSRPLDVTRLPFHAPALFERARSALCTPPAAATGALWGSDRDAGVVSAAQANAERAEVGDAARFTRCALSAAELPPGPGLIVTNPPYGRRVGAGRPLRDLYAALGALRKRAPQGYRLALVTSQPSLARATGVPLRSVLMTDAGGVKVCFYVEDEPGLLRPDPTKP